MMDALPIELVDLVFSFLDDDKLTLSNCTLLNRHFHEISRTRLFHKITIFSSLSAVHTVAAFCRYLASGCEESKRAQPLIKVLRVANKSLSGPITPTSSYELGYILQHLPALQDLELCNISLLATAGCPIPGWNFDSYRPKSLRRVEIDGVCFELQDGQEDTAVCSLTQLFDLFGTVETLHILTIRPLLWGDEEPQAIAKLVKAAGQSISTTFKVQKLIASPRPFTSLLAIQILGGSPRSLSDVQSLDIREELLVSVDKDLRPVRKSLKHLHLRIVASSLIEDTRPYTFSSYSQLSSLTLTVIIIQYQSECDSAASTMACAMEAILDIPPSLSELFINFRCVYREQPRSILNCLDDGERWDDVDEMLTKHPALQSVLIQFEDIQRSGAKALQADIESISKRLSRLNASRKLTVTQK
ncbi:hypothetical protein EIP91_001017 [Steccherinum ochraceum]|uniref:F-box domain-containing protein n=1 Tax=Steccherinum ochraceum TaxID=92696 RepID=A0A4R0RVF9_9APHY|nr:hypothetical protein EIP91_001017 [Steccherinum ochraceum]